MYVHFQCKKYHVYPNLRICNKLKLKIEIEIEIVGGNFYHGLYEIFSTVLVYYVLKGFTPKVCISYCQIDERFISQWIEKHRRSGQNEHIHFLLLYLGHEHDCFIVIFENFSKFCFVIKLPQKRT